MPAATLLLKARFPLFPICSVLVLGKLLGPALGRPLGRRPGWQPGEPPPTSPPHCWRSSCKTASKWGPQAVRTPWPGGARRPCLHVASLQVTGRRLWKNVYDELGGSPGSTSAATCTRRHYERYGQARGSQDLGLHPQGWTSRALSGEGRLQACRPPGRDEGERGPPWVVCVLAGQGCSRSGAGGGRVGLERWEPAASLASWSACPVPPQVGPPIRAAPEGRG